MSSFVRIAVCITLISMSCNSQAMICSIGREPDPAYGNKLRWMIPVPDPCHCTEIRMGGTNARPPCRSFTVTYHDTPIISNDYEEIRNWLGCPDINECDEQTHTCNPSHYEECFNTPGSYNCVCQQGYQRSQSDVPCKACHFSTVPHPTPYSYMFILEPQISPFTLNFSVKANGVAIVGLSENRDDTSVVIEILLGYYPGNKRIVVRACMPHLCKTYNGDGSLYVEYTDTSAVTVGTEYRPFWIHYDEGVVTAGKRGQQNDLVKWDAGDHHGLVPTQLHIGISTWENGDGEWDFCQ